MKKFLFTAIFYLIFSGCTTNKNMVIIGGKNNQIKSNDSNEFNINNSFKAF